MSLQQLIARMLADQLTLTWHVTLSGAIRRSDGACPLEACAGTGPHSLYSKAAQKLDILSLDIERISAAADMDWWPHRMAEWQIRKMLLDALGLIEDERDNGRFKEAA